MGLVVPGVSSLVGPHTGWWGAAGGDAAEGCMQRVLRVLKNSAVTGSLG